jgi:hypothetical protein
LPVGHGPFGPGAVGQDYYAGVALAGARRIRDLLTLVPGLFAWQVAESSGKAHVRMVSVLANAIQTKDDKFK